MSELGGWAEQSEGGADGPAGVGGQDGPHTTAKRGRAHHRLAELGSWRGVCLTLLVGVLGAVAARQLQLPGGAFTGALLGTAAARLLGQPLDELPLCLKSGGRILLGLTIGAAVTADTLRVVALALPAVTTIILSMIVAGLVVAWAISRLTTMTLPTALCSSTPGALAAMVTLAEDLGGDSRVVASMQLVRLVAILLLVPVSVRHAFAATPAAAALPVSAAGPEASLLQLSLLLGLGLAVGWGASRLRVPAGDLLAGLVVAALASAFFPQLAQAPASWRFLAQWMIGAGVGASVTWATLRSFRPFALTGGLMTAFLIVAGLGLGWLLAQITSLDLVTCIVACTPGGADQMVILAGELGADGHFVAATHIARQIILLLLLPVLTRIAAGRRLAPGLS